MCHATWTHGVKVEKAAKVKKFIIFHHDPAHDDRFINKLKEKQGKNLRNPMLRMKAWN
jgi:phosphoribosyl 1,2-cyclic phosphodiesterase